MQIIFCSCVNDTTLFKFPFLRSLRLDYQIKDRARETAEIEPCDRSFVKKNGRALPGDIHWKQTWWSNDKTIIELGNRKISLFVSVSQINYYLPQRSAWANDWSARHWHITIIYPVRRHNTVHYTECISTGHLWLYSMKYIPIQARRHIWTRVKRCFDSVIILRNEWNIEEYPCFRGCAVYVEMWCSTAVGWRCIPESIQMGKLLRRGDWDQV